MSSQERQDLTTTDKMTTAKGPKVYNRPINAGRSSREFSRKLEVLAKEEMINKDSSFPKEDGARIDSYTHKNRDYQKIKRFKLDVTYQNNEPYEANLTLFNPTSLEEERLLKLIGMHN